MPEWLKGADCKSAGECLQRFKSSLLHHKDLSKLPKKDVISDSLARVAQMVEHFLGKEKVIGSSPIAGSRKRAKSLTSPSNFPVHNDFRILIRRSMLLEMLPEAIIVFVPEIEYSEKNRMIIISKI